MIRVPTPLIEYVNELSRLYRQGKAKPLFHQLQQLIAAVDSSSDTQSSQSSNTIDSTSIATLIQSVKHIELILEQAASKVASNNAIILVEAPGAENFSSDIATDSKLDSALEKQAGLTIAELAEKLGISQRQVYRLRQANQLAGWKTMGKGKTLRYIPADEG
jgi:excisionase family DNA binding protein